MARTVDLGVTQWLWLPGEDAIANELAATVAELTAASVVNISTQVVTTTDVQVQASDTVNERSVTDVANVVVPTVGNYGGNLILFRDYTLGVPMAVRGQFIIQDKEVMRVANGLRVPNAFLADGSQRTPSG